MLEVYGTLCQAISSFVHMVAVPFVPITPGRSIPERAELRQTRDHPSIQPAPGPRPISVAPIIRISGTRLCVPREHIHNFGSLTGHFDVPVTFSPEATEPPALRRGLFSFHYSSSLPPAPSSPNSPVKSLTDPHPHSENPHT